VRHHLATRDIEEGGLRPERHPVVGGADGDAHITLCPDSVTHQKRRELVGRQFEVSRHWRWHDRLRTLGASDLRRGD
jgi:hypothetical protein